MIPGGEPEDDNAQKKDKKKKNSGSTSAANNSAGPQFFPNAMLIALTPFQRSWLEAIFEGENQKCCKTTSASQVFSD
jgi:hypothetical protein